MRLGAPTGRLLMLALLAGVCWLPSGRAADSPDRSAADGELAKLQGTWTVVSMENRGTKVQPDSIANYVLTIKGADWTVTNVTQQVASYTIRLDPSASPKQIDLTPTAGNTQAPSQGIYKLDGDTLTLCRTLGGKERSKEFQTTESAGILVVWKRANK